MIDSLDVEITYCVSVDIGDLGITDLDDLTDDQVLGLFDAYNDADQHKYEYEQECPQLDGTRVWSKYYGRYCELCEERLEREENGSVKDQDLS